MDPGVSDTFEDQGDLSAVMDGLRVNLRLAGIPAGDADLAEVAAQGYLRTVAMFERIIRSTASAAAPDYLSAPAPELVEDKPFVCSDLAGQAAGPLRYPQPPGHDAAAQLAFATIGEVAELLRTRQVSSVELTALMLNRIQRHDVQLNAFQLVLAERALETARIADDAIAADRYRGPLHGVPIAVKDIFAMRGIPTAAGSKILANWVPDFEATAVERLEMAGAVIIGKTRMSEFAYSPGSNNLHYGPTRNPWRLDHDTGGSSSGSGAAVAAGLAYGALGTDTGGSIRIPASLCGITGLKPSFGRVSLFGAVPLSWSLDHAGPMARSVGDCALLLEVVAGRDRRDPRTRLPLTSAGSGPTVAEARIGVISDSSLQHGLGTEDTVAAWRAGLEKLEQLGATLVLVDLPELDDLRIINSVILVLEAAAFHEQHLRDRFLEMGEFPRRRLLQAFAYSPTALVHAQQARAALRARVAELFEGIDVLSTPTMPGSAPPLGQPASTTFTAPINLLGLPAISVPVGKDALGLPLGLQLIGRPGCEAMVVRVAHALEGQGVWLQAVP